MDGPNPFSRKRPRVYIFFVRRIYILKGLRAHAAPSRGFNFGYECLPKTAARRAPPSTPVDERGLESDKDAQKNTDRSPRPSAGGSPPAARTGVCSCVVRETERGRI